jgi:hypothetical protein
MALIVRCECGECLEADEDQAGQQVPCAACGKMLELPQAYNPLSMAKYVQTAPQQPQEEPVDSRPECPDCAGTGHCPRCSGTGMLKQEPLERVMTGIQNAIAGVLRSISDALGTGPTGGRRIQTRSERRRAGACPYCEGSAKCFKCEGSGRFAE